MKKEKKFDPIPETVDDALTIWDSGESLFSVELGGLGPGYEMAIQGLAFELARLYRDILDWKQTESNRGFDELIIQACGYEPWGNFSGAQVVMARNFAACVCRQGYRKALRDPKIKDRLIQVSRLDLRQVEQP